MNNPAPVFLRASDLLVWLAVWLALWLVGRGLSLGCGMLAESVPVTWVGTSGPVLLFVQYILISTCTMADHPRM